MDKENENTKDSAEDGGQALNWIVVGETASRTQAEFAVNGLRDYDIPAVLDARPGVLGTAGMVLRSLYTGQVTTFRILVPEEYKDEAEGIIGQYIGSGSDAGKIIENDESETET